MGQHESRQAGEFHPRHGKNIQLSENNTVAHRVRDFDQALVYSSKPISRGEVFQVRLLEKAETWSGSVVRGGTGAAQLWRGRTWFQFPKCRNGIESSLYQH